MRSVSEQFHAWDGRIYEKLNVNLVNWAEALFSYHPVLVEALAPLTERWGSPAIQALSRIWQIEADEKRHPMSLLERQARQVQLVDGEKSTRTNSPLSDLVDSFFSLCYSPITPWSVKKCQSNSLEF